MTDPVWHLVFMGVSGSGKTTAAHAVNDRLGWPFAEGDDFHSEENVAKMAAGHPLTDADRMPWLGRLAAWAREHDGAGRSTVMSCSALLPPNMPCAVPDAAGMPPAVQPVHVPLSWIPEAPVNCDTLPQPVACQSPSTVAFTSYLVTICEAKLTSTSSLVIAPVVPLKFDTKRGSPPFSS